MILTRVFPVGDPVAVDLTDADSRDRLSALYDPGTRDWLRLNLITSVSGSAAGVDGTSETLTNRADRALLGVIRRLSDVVLVGAASVRAEGYRLPRHARLAILTGSGDLAAHRIAGHVEAGRVLILCPSSASAAVRASIGTLDAEIVELDDIDGRIDVRVVVAALVARGHTSIVCEGGPMLAAQLIGADLVDELCLSTSARLTSTLLPLFGHADVVERELELTQLLVDDTSGVYARWAIPRRASDPPATP